MKYTSNNIEHKGIQQQLNCMIKNDSAFSEDWDDRALNLSMDLKINGKSPEIELPKSKGNPNNNTSSGEPQNRRETSHLQFQSDNFPTTELSAVEANDMEFERRETSSKTAADHSMLFRENNGTDFEQNRATHQTADEEFSMLERGVVNPREFQGQINALIEMGRQQSILPRRKQVYIFNESFFA
jgi:hypothetical protein